MSTTFRVFELGFGPIIDTVEGNLTSENHAALQGMTFGSSLAPLWGQIRTFSPDPGSGPGVDGDASSYNADNAVAMEGFLIDGNGPRFFDAGMIYADTLITYTDGTSVVISVPIIQDTDGRLYLVPPASGPNALSNALEAGPIQSVTLGTAQPADGTNIYNMYAERFQIDPKVPEQPAPDPAPEVVPMLGFLDPESEFAFLDPEDRLPVICFTAGTLIATARGAIRVEALQVGDLVVTRDHGVQPVRWIGLRKVPATGVHAPIRIRPAGLRGLERDLLVSPQHRLLIRGPRVEMLFATSEILVAAQYLIDGRTITREEGGTVTYVHFLCDQHEIVHAHGALTESFHPGSAGLKALTGPAREEIFALFPELRSHHAGYGRTARRCLRQYEAAAMIGP